MSEPQIPVEKPVGKKILFCFLGFFGVVAAVDAAFVYTAIRTHSGLVTEQAYEKGLAYNETLSKARSQPQVRQTASYTNGVFRWTIADEKGNPVTGAKVDVSFFRPVKDGSDFKAGMTETAAGTYEIKPAFPLNGLWTAELDAKWNDKQYQTTKEIIAK